MKNGFKIMVLTGLVVMGGIPVKARASLPDIPEIKKMTEESDLIVSGTVLGIEQPGDGTTRINLKIKEILKGAAPGEATVQFVVPGGAVENSTTPLVAENEPVFHEKERTIVFLSINGDHFEIDRAREGKQPGEGADAKSLEGTIQEYLTKKTLR